MLQYIYKKKMSHQRKNEEEEIFIGLKSLSPSFTFPLCVCRKLLSGFRISRRILLEIEN